MNPKQPATPEGDAPLINDVFSLLYDDLTRQARGIIRKNRAGEWLEPEALIGSAFEKLKRNPVEFRGDKRGKLLFLKKIMAQLCIDLIRERTRIKRNVNAEATWDEQTMGGVFTSGFSNDALQRTISEILKFTPERSVAVGLVGNPAGLPALLNSFQKGELEEVEPFLDLLRNQMKQFMSNDLKIEMGSGFDPNHLDVIINNTLKRKMMAPGLNGESTFLCFQLYLLIRSELLEKYSPAKGFANLTITEAEPQQILQNSCQRALQRLKDQDPETAKVFVLKVFFSLTIEELAIYFGKTSHRIRYQHGQAAAEMKKWVYHDFDSDLSPGKASAGLR